jgi:thiamine biosynthesis lipoprotein
MRLRFVSLLLMLLISCCSKQPLTMITGPTMGTTWSLQTVEADSALQQLIQTHLDQREAVLSHWRKDSALSAFNAATSTDWQPVPRELVEVVTLARRIADQTDGVLDITLAPMIEAAGFAPKLTSSTSMVTGWQHLHARLDPPALKKDVPELRLNVASVTEGFVMDELITMLKGKGMSDFLLEVGGEVAAMGLSPTGKPWQVGIQTPEAAPGQVMETLPLSDICVSTSGSYRHRQGSETHLIDPRTARPISSALASVSVIHPSCALADGYATALMVLGPDRGKLVAEKLGLRVIWILEQTD